MIEIHQAVHEKKLSVHFHVDAVIHYDLLRCSRAEIFHILTLLHSERPKLHTILAYLSAIGLKRHSYKAASYQVWPKSIHPFMRNSLNKKFLTTKDS